MTMYDYHNKLAYRYSHTRLPHSPLSPYTIPSHIKAATPAAVAVPLGQASVSYTSGLRNTYTCFQCAVLSDNKDLSRSTLVITKSSLGLLRLY